MKLTSICQLIADMIADFHSYERESAVSKNSDVGGIKMDEIKNKLNTLDNKINVLYKLLVSIDKKLSDSATRPAGFGVVVKSPLPWNLSNKEVYMLSKQYTLAEIELLTGYDQDKIKSCIEKHASSNF